jgi:hypothetical protein
MLGSGQDCAKTRRPRFGEFMNVKNLSCLLRRPVACAAVALLTACAGSATPRVDGFAPSDRAFSPAATRATYYGCPVFAADSYYNVVVTNAAADPNSAKYISSVIQAGDGFGFDASTGVEGVNLANNLTPMHKVQPQVHYNKFPVPYPWQSSFYIEPLGDRHAMTVQTQKCRLYESYFTTFADGTLSAYSGAHWDMTKRFDPLPPGKASAMASGLSLFAGMVRWEDYQSGSIRHALNWDGIAHTVSQYSFVRPASTTGRLPFYGSSFYRLPYGAHLRLRSSYSTAGLGPQATMVVIAMKTYGIYLADTGTSFNMLYFANANNTNPWDQHDLSSLSEIKLSDFTVLKLGHISSVH